jgi:hypothetical protein
MSLIQYDTISNKKNLHRKIYSTCGIAIVWMQGFYLNKTKLESIIETPDYCLMSLIMASVRTVLHVTSNKNTNLFEIIYA